MYSEPLIPPLPRQAACWLRLAGAACVLGFLVISAAQLFLGGSSAVGPAKAGGFGEASARVKPYDPLDTR